MMKRIIALLLALILTVGLLPTVALAEDAPEEGGQTAASSVSTVQSGTDSDNNTDNPVHVVKTFTPGEDGEFGSLTLEAYVTNPLQVVTETTPLDIVLVLDQSGSMGYCINCGTEFNNEKWDNDQCNTTSASYQYTVVSRANADKNKTYYTPVDGKYYKADWCDGWHWFGIIPYKDHEEGWYYYGDYGHTRVTGDLYVRTKITGHKHRLDALTEALNTFVNSVVANGGDHNVAVVGYAGTRNSSNDKSYAHNSELLTGTNLNRGSEYSGNDSRYYPQKDLTKDPINGKAYTDLYTSSQEYSRALQSMRTKQGVASVRAAINALTANGATRTYAGMDMAKNILAKAKTANSNRQQVVILFTDGDTNSEQDDVYDLANSMKNNGVLIYTVGLFKDADQTKGEYDREKERDDYNLFLNKVSNNSIEYKNQGSKPRTKTDKTYYLPAQDAASLSAVFAQISREVSKLDLKVDSKAILQDTLSGYFTFDADTNAAGSITVQTAAFEGIDANGQMKWGTPENATGTTVEVTGKKITVTGFDYGSSENLVTVHETGDPKYTGKKLIVTIPIKPDTTSNVTWSAKENPYDTNSTAKGTEAGLSGYGYQDKTGTLSTTLPTSPKAPVTGYTVTYAWANGNQYTGATLPTGGTYINGQKHDVASGLADVTGHRFEGWHTDEDCTDSADGEVVINGSNVTLYGRYVKNTTKVNLTDYIQKTLTATSLPNGYKETFKAKITGTPITVEGGLEITTPEFSAAGTQNFTGTAEVELTHGQNYTFKVKEVKPTTGATEGMTYDETEYTLTVKVSDTGVVTTESSNGGGATKVTITNEYKPGSIDFSLTNKFQKTLNSNVTFDDLPAGANEFTLGIWEGNTAESTPKYTATANIDKLTASGSTYSETVSFGSVSLPIDAVGTKTYTVKEVVPTTPVAGMKYDTTAYTMTIKVKDKAGKLTVTEATVSDGTNAINLLNTTGTNSLEITNTFTAATLPLDPDPTTGTTAKVIKVLSDDSTATTEDMTFRASMTGGLGVARRVARATVKAGEKTADFSGFGTLVFTEEKVYEYEIYEETTASDRIPGVRYDQTRYTLTVDVRENTTNHELYINSAQYTAGQVEGNILTTPITFTNKYTKPENATVVSKTVVTDLLTLSSPMRNAIHNFESINETTILYPVANNGTNTLEVTKGTTTARLLYKISVDAGTQQFLQFDDANVDSYWYDGDKVAVSRAGSGFKVEFKNNVRTADIYVTVNHKLNFDKGKCTVENVISEEIKATTTVTEKDPDKCTIDFSTLIFKVLTKTGDRSFNGAEFTASVDGWKVNQYDVMSMRVIKTHFVDLQPVTLKATFPANTTFDADGKAYRGFTGDTLTVTAGRYLFLIDEINDGQTNITYDESKYWLNLGFMENAEGKVSLAGQRVRKFVDGDTYETVLALEDREWMVVDTSISPVYFENTIDTGKDDYYPIIIPTIINKDTGMLNKTDHFAYVIGYPDGTVHPNGQITRAEVATIFFRLLRDEVRDGAFTTSNSYSDVAYGKWYNNPISTMSALGIITGYPDGTFKPNKPITRAEFAAIAARFDETQSGKSATFSDVIGHWAAKEIGIAYYNDWIKGYPDGTFKPDQNITRAEAMTLINRVLERKPESPADLLTNMNKWTDNMDTSKWYYLDVQEATNSHGYTRKTFNYELWRQMLPDPDWSRYER